MAALVDLDGGVADAPAVETIRILNVDIANTTFDWLLDNLRHGVLFTPNVDHLVRLQRDRSFREIYSHATHLSVDSRIVMMAARSLGTPFVEQIAGSDFFPAYCRHHRDDPTVRVFLLGGRTPEVAAEAMRRLNGGAGRAVVVGAHSPPFGFEYTPVETRRALEEISRSGANVVAVGVGSPKQETWIVEHRHELPQVDLFMAVGATIDFIAGAERRSPRVLTRFGLEWLFRMSRDPGRLWRRYLRDDPPFAWWILQQRVGRYRDPFPDLSRPPSAV